jgi:hypothetical protein
MDDGRHDPGRQSDKRRMRLLGTVGRSEVVGPVTQQPQERVDRYRGTTKPSVEQGSPRRQEALVVQIGVDRLQLGGQPLGLLGQQQLPDRGLRIGLAQHRCLQRTRRQENHNRVIQPRTRPRIPTFPQLNRYLGRDFFRGK